METSERPTATDDDTLRIALWVAIAALVGAVLPIWPYGYYTLLRLIVTGVALSRDMPITK
jgi:hypothetical protein